MSSCAQSARAGRLRCLCRGAQGDRRGTEPNLRPSKRTASRAVVNYDSTCLERRLTVVVTILPQARCLMYAEDRVNKVRGESSN